MYSIDSLSISSGRSFYLNYVHYKRITTVEKNQHYNDAYFHIYV